MSYVPVTIWARTPMRGVGSQEQRMFPAKEVDGQWSWGSSPSQVMVRYVGEAPVTVGAELEIEAGPYRLWGLCKSDVSAERESGFSRVLTFYDFREYLSWDQVFGSFNEVDVRYVGGRRVRRWRHVYPEDWPVGLETFTDAPVSARFIIEKCLAAPTVGSPWAAGGPVFHEDQEYPVFGVDCSGGKPLGALLQELSDRQGLLFCVADGPYKLQWARKGEGVLPAFPFKSRRRLGAALSGNPSRVRVVGDRNLYQLEVSLVPDWNRALGAAFLEVGDFIQLVYVAFTDPATGLVYKPAEPTTPEEEADYEQRQYIGWQRAAARAHRLTLRELCAYYGQDFVDTRRFQGRSRMDMPVVAYLEGLVNRAFAPVVSSLINIYGQTVPGAALRLVDRQLCKVEHDAATGVLAQDPDEPEDGNGYVIAKGFMVGSDVFRTLRPETTDPELFKANKCAWQHVAFSIDDSGEGYRFIILEEPAIVSEDLFLEDPDTKLMKLNAHATVTTPSIKGVLTFAAERYQYVLGDPGKDVTESEPLLNGEFVWLGGWAEIPYGDGAWVDQKAAEIASVLLRCQYAYIEGGWETPVPTGIGLSGVIDRVSLRAGDGGLEEAVDFTNERGPSAFVPSRELDRRTVQNSMFPGQKELRERARYYEAVAAGLKGNPAGSVALRKMLAGEFPNMHTAKVQVDPPEDAPEHEAVVNTITRGADEWAFECQTCGEREWHGPMIGGQATLEAEFKYNHTRCKPPVPAGTPLRGKPVVPGASGNDQVSAAHPEDGTSEHTRFAGVTVRHNETPTNRQVTVVTGGRCGALVQGPVGMNASIGMEANGEAYLVAGGSPVVGKALQEIAGDDLRYILVDLGAGGGGGGGLETWV